MNRVDQYLNAAERASTRHSYDSAIRHFEIEWGELLPSSVDNVARYLAEHAESLSLNTLKHRLAALSRWHQDHGFTDPTKAAKIRQVIKGIRALHPSREKRAKLLELEILQSICEWLTDAESAATAREDDAGVLRHARDRALVLLGFWRGFRADELVGLGIEFIEITPGVFSASQQRRSAIGRTQLFLSGAFSIVCCRGCGALAGFVGVKGRAAVPENQSLGPTRRNRTCSRQQHSNAA